MSLLTELCNQLMIETGTRIISLHYTGAMQLADLIQLRGGGERFWEGRLHPTC